ncbi:MAG: cell division protein FtsQ [Cytophagales bacterium]|nr:cell division protein FtsQ [Cytophagales bacterium]
MKKTWNSERWKKNFPFLGAGLFFLLLVLIVYKKNQKLRCKEIQVEVENRHKNYFINEQDVIKLLTQNGKRQVLGAYINELNLKSLEDDVEKHHFVKNAEIVKDFKGNLFVRVVQNRPLARLVREYAPDAYLKADGKVLPLSDRFTARVTLVSGEYVKKYLKLDGAEDKYFREILTLLALINKDSFLKAQIAQVDIDRQGQIKLFPQVGKQVFEFGLAENIEDKLRKFKIFHAKILPFKGWNTYKRVNLEFHDQIICE